MWQHIETLHVDVPPETAFDIVLDPDAQTSRFMKVEVVKETPEGVGTEFRYDYLLMGRRFGGGTGTFVEYVPGKRFKWEFSGGLEMALTGGPVSATWSFEPADGGTDVTIHSEFTTRIPVVNHLARGIMMWSWRTRQLPKFKAEIEKRAKVGAKA